MISLHRYCVRRSIAWVEYQEFLTDFPEKAKGGIIDAALLLPASLGRRTLKQVNVFYREPAEGGDTPGRPILEYVAVGALAAQFCTAGTHGFQRFVVEVQERTVDVTANLTLASFDHASVGIAKE